MQHRLHIDGLLFNVLDEGVGEPVLLVHGFPDDHTVWRHQVSALVSAGYRVIAPDTRGCGDTEMAPRTSEYKLPRLVADLVAILDALGLDRVKLVGHDWGAVIAWVFAAKHPERVERFVALSVGHAAAYAAGPLEQKLKGWYVLMFQLRGFAEGLIKAVPMRQSHQIRPPGSRSNADGLPIQEPSREIRLGIKLLATGGFFSFIDYIQSSQIDFEEQDIYIQNIDLSVLRFEFDFSCALLRFSLKTRYAGRAGRNPRP